MKRNRLYRFGAAITAALLCAVLSAQAAVPAVINYQSRLRTTAGAAITTATRVSFSLYSAATGGAALWTESYSQSSGACAKVTPDANGYFSVQMGSCEAFPSTLTFTTPLYLGVTIENDAEASPRVAFAPAPYAMNAVRVGNFVSDTSAGTLTGEPLGMATAGTQGFHSAGLLLQGSGWNGSAAANKGFKVRTTATDASNYRLSILDSGDGSESVSILNNGRVGIGITNPQSELEVAGVIYANDFRTRGGSISTTGDGTNDLIRFTRPKLLVGFTSDLNNPTSNLKSLMSLTASDVTFLEETSFNKLVSIPNRQIKFGANTFTFPVAAPATDGLVLTTDTDGTLSWTSKSSAGGGTVSSVGLSAPSDFTVSGTPVTDTGTLGFTWKTQSPNDILAGPATGVADGTPTFRSLVAGDIPNLDAGKITSGTINAARLPTLTAADIPNLDAGKITSGILDTPRGGTGIGTYAKGQIIYADAINSLATLGLGSNGTVLTANSVTGLPEWKAIPSSSGGTVTSVSATIPSSLLTLSGSPITDSGTLAFDLASQQANEVFVGPLTGTAKPTFRSLSAVDIPALDAAKITTGTLPVTRGGTGISSNAKGDLIYGDAINSLAKLGIGSSGQFLGVDATGVPAWKPIPTDAGGTVKSVAFTAPSIFSVIGTPITDTGTIALSLTDQGAKEVLIGPPAGSAPGTPTFRVLSPSDIPSLDASQVPTGTFSIGQIPILDTTKINFPTLSPGKVFIGPVSGSPIQPDAKPTFRSLVSADIPDLSADQINSGTFNIARIPEIPALQVVGGQLSTSVIPTLDIATKTSGTLAVTRGGTGIAATEKGDILFSDAINSLAALGIGTTGKILTVNSAGLPEWKDPATNGTVASVGLTSTSPLFAAFGAPVTGSGTISVNIANQEPNEFFAGPPSGATGMTAAPAFRQLVATDIPNLSAQHIVNGVFAPARIPDLDAAKITSGTLDAARLPAFTTSQIPDLSADKITSGVFDAARIPTLGVAQIPDLGAEKITSGVLSADRVPVLDIATKTSGSLAVTRGGTGINATTKGDILFSDAINSIAALGIGSTGQILTVNSAGLPVWNAPATNGTVTSVAATVPSFLTVSGSPITGAGTLAVDLATQARGEVFIGPISGADAKPAFRGLVSADIPNLDASKITTGSFSNTQIPNLDASKVATGVFSSALIPSLDAAKVTTGVFDSARLPALTAAQVPDLDAGKIVSGVFNSARIPVLGASQVPDLDAAKITTGIFAAARLPNLGVAQGGTGLTGTTKGDILFSDAINSIAALGIGSTGQILSVNSAGLPVWKDASATGVISVGLSLPSLFTVSGSPVTASGTLSATLALQGKNKFFGGPVSNADAAPSFRALDPLDVPDLSADKITSGVFSAARIPSIASSSVPDLDAAKITSGIFGVARGGTGLSTVGAAGTVLTSVGGVPQWSPVPTGLGGSGAFGQLAFWNASSTLAGNTKLIVDSVNSRLSIGSSAAPATTLVVAGDTTVGGDVVPSTASAYDFGSTTKPVRSVYSDNLGSATQRIKAAYIDELYIYGGAGGSGTSTISATQTVFNGIAYNWPNGGLGNNFVLTTDTNGNLGWQNPISLVPDSGWRSLGGSVRLGVITDKVGIGTASPAEKLDVVGNIQASGLLSSGSGQIKFGGATYNFPTTLPSSGQILAASSTPGSLQFRSLAATDIPVLDASKITTGVFSSAQIPAVSSSSIPNLDASKITTGVFPVARGGTGLSAVGTNGQVLTVASGTVAWATPAVGLSAQAGANINGFIPMFNGTNSLTNSNIFLNIANNTLNIGANAPIYLGQVGGQDQIIANTLLTAQAGFIAKTTAWLRDVYIGNGPAVGGVGTLTIESGSGFAIKTNAGAGKVLTSDVNGNATWQAPGSGIGGSGTVNKLALFSATGTVTDSLVSQSAGAVTVGGGLSVTGAVNFATTTTVSGDIMPTNDGTQNIGSNAKRFGIIRSASNWVNYLTVYNSSSLYGNTTLGNAVTDVVSIVGKLSLGSGANGTPGLGKVLTSDASGNATWQTPSGSSDIQRPGTANLSVGASMPSGVTGQFNVALGGASLGQLTSGSANTGLGSTALELNTTGSENTAIGTTALRSNVSGNRNTAIGRNAGFAVTGSGNTFIGAGADASGVISNSIAIGEAASATKSNQVVLGRSSITETLLRGSVITGGNLLPEGDNVYDLGSPTKRWRDIYVGPATIKVVGSNGQIIESIGAGSGSNAGKLVVKALDGSERQIGGSSAGIPASAPAGTALLSPIGSAGTPAFRILTPLDIPSLDVSKITTGALPVTNGGTGLSSVGSNGQVLTVVNGLPSWQAPATGGGSGITGSGGNGFVPLWNGAGSLGMSMLQQIAGGTPTLSVAGHLSVVGGTTLGSNGNNTIINGGLVIPSGAGAGKVLTADAAGNATWQAVATGGGGGVSGSGTAGRIPLFSSSGVIGDSSISQLSSVNGVSGGISVSTSGFYPSGNADNPNSYSTILGTPTHRWSQLYLSDSLFITGGAGAGKVLTSDASGRGTWQAPASGGGAETGTYSGGAKTISAGKLSVNGNVEILNGPGKSFGFYSSGGTWMNVLGLSTSGDSVSLNQNLSSGGSLNLRNSNSSGKISFQIGGTEKYLINSSGASSPSDKRLKGDIRELSNVLTKLDVVHGVNFTWNDDTLKKRQLGVIAQDVEKAFPELVSMDDATGIKAVNYGGLAAVAIQGVKELDAKVEAAMPITGEGVIRPGESEVLIFTSQVSTGAKVFITPVGSTGGQTLYVDKVVDGEYFTVKTDKAARSPARFNWMIIK